MYALALIRYRRPVDEVLAATDDHRAYLKTLKERGVLVASGPLVPRFGGALLLHVAGDDPDAVQGALDAVRDGDPYWQRGLAQYELLPWAPGIGRDDLDRLVGGAA